MCYWGIGCKGTEYGGAVKLADISLDRYNLPIICTPYELLGG